MTEKQKEQRIKAYERTDYICPVCGGSIYQYGTMQYAHKISNKEIWRKKYGTFIIDHTLNGEYVCSLGCNASCDVGSSYGNHLEVIADILIAEYIKMWGIEGIGKLSDKLLKEYEKYKKIYRGVK